MKPKDYWRRWEVYLRGDKIGEVFAATEQAACLRAIKRFGIKKDDQVKLHVRRIKGTSP